MTKLTQNIIVKGKKDGHIIDIHCSNIVMGSGDFFREDNLEVAGPVMNQFLALGGNTFDTGRHYRHSENALGVWMEKEGNRQFINILTKCCHPVRGALDVPRVTPEAIEEDLATSLSLLRTDHVEMLLLHRDDETQPVGPIMEKLHEIVESGRAYAFGVSNWELPRIQEAMAYCEAHGLNTISLNSPNLSLAKTLEPRWPDCVSANDAMIEWHRQTGLPLFSWSSQAGGFFSGRFTPEDRTDEDMVNSYYIDENWQRYERVNVLSKELGITPIQLSLAFVLNYDFPVAAIIGSENAEEMLASIEATTIKLTNEQMTWLDLRSN